MDLINSNIVLNISVVKIKSDISSLTTDVNALITALNTLGGLKPKITLGVTDADVTRVNEMARALRELNAAKGGGVGVAGSGGALAAVGLDPRSINTAKQGIYAVAKQLHRGANIASKDMIRPGMDPIGLPVPGSAESVKIRERMYEDAKGKQHTAKVEEFTNQKINGVLRERVQIQQKIVDGEYKEKTVKAEVVNVNQKLLVKEQERNLIAEKRRREIETNVRTSRARVSQWVRPVKQGGEGFTEDPFARRPQEEWINGKKVQYQVREFRKELEGGVVAIRKINESTNIMHPRLGKSVEHAREIRRVMAAAAKSARQVREQASRNKTLGEFTRDAEESGFKSGGIRKRLDTRTKVTTETHQYWKSQRAGLAQYLITLREYNALTGLMTERTLRGSEAARFLGDSIFRAGEKVLMWTVSTTILFQAIRVIRALGEEIITLEANTVLLARVADKLVTTYGAVGSSFELKRKIAERLTAQIIDLTQAIGGSASEAQKAAAVFLRAGQSEREVILSVTAALLASKIAEMEVADASNLLVSATLQFEMAASELLPTLDSLNTLSNNYKVTTKDLLDSISRAGSVFAAHNGKIEELAAMTAVIAEVTSRTGTQIGNAVKTIQSRLDRVEVKKNLFQRLQISTADMTGKARSLSDMLLELQIRMEGLSETEQNELTIQAAGVRQRAIMVSAINEADKIIIAYNKSLMESGSAQDEFQEQVGTIAAALERMKGTFSAIAASMSGFGGGAMNAIINLIDTILRMINAFDGLAIKMAGYSIAFLVLRRVIRPLVAVDFPALQAAILRTTATINMSGARLSFLGRQFGKVGAAAYVLGGGLSYVGASLMALLTPLNIATVVVGLAVWGLTELSIASNTAIDSTDKYTNAIYEQISAEDKRRRAIVSSINYVSKLAAEIHRLNLVMEASGEPGKYTERIKSIVEVANSIMQSIGGGTIDLTDEFGKLRLESVAELHARGMKLEMDRINNELEIIDVQSGRIQAKLDKARSKEREEWPRNVTDFRYRVGETGDPGFKNPYRIGSVGQFDEYSRTLADYARKARLMKMQTGEMGFGELREFYDSLEGLDKHIYDNSDAIIRFSENISTWMETSIEASLAANVLKEELEDLATKKAGLQSELVNPDDMVNLESVIFKTLEGASEVYKIMEELDNINKAESMTGMSLPFEETDEAIAMLGRSIKKATIGLRQWLDINRGLSTKDIEDHIKLIEKGTEVYDKAVKARRDSVRKERASFGATQFKIRDQLAEAFATSKEGTAGSNKLLSDTFGFATIESHMARVADRIKAAKAELVAMPGLERGPYGSTNAQKKKFQDEEGTRLSKKVYIQKELNSLRDLEVQKATSLQKAEEQIAESRKKAADEAARSLGMLSQQDKLRVLAQAQYFKENPDRVISPADAFGTTAPGWKTTSQYFSSKMRSFDPEGSPYEKLMAAAGLGMTPEIINSQERLALAADATATSLERMNESLERATDYDVEARIVGGESSITSERKKSIGYDDAAVDQFSINVNRGAVDFSGFGEDFVALVRPLVRDEVRAAAKYIEDTRPPQPTRQGIKPAQ